MNDMLELQMAASAFKDSIPKDAPLTERIEFAIRYVCEHESAVFWMSHRVTDDLMVRTALAAVMLTGNDEDRETINHSMKPLKALSALLSGVPVDMSAIDMEGVLPIMKMFHAAKDARKTP